MSPCNTVIFDVFWGKTSNVTILQGDEALPATAGKYYHLTGGHPPLSPCKMVIFDVFWGKTSNITILQGDELPLYQQSPNTSDDISRHKKMQAAVGSHRLTLLLLAAGAPVDCNHPVAEATLEQTSHHKFCKNTNQQVETPTMSQSQDSADASSEDPLAEPKQNTSNDEDSSEQDKKPAAKKKKHKPAVLCPRLEGETDSVYKRRRQRFFTSRTRMKKKQANMEAKKALSVKLNQASTANNSANEDDPFVKWVLGADNFHKEKGKKWFNACKSAVCLRLCVSERVWKVHVEQKSGHFLENDDDETREFKVQFHTTGDDVTKNESQKVVQEQGRMNWLRIKKSTIEGAGFGCFADRDFEEGSIIGLYMGSQDPAKGDLGYSMKSKSTGLQLHCHSFTNPKSMKEQVTKTMGMQMLNDPNYGGKASGKEVNAVCQTDMLVCAKKDIKRGEEIFIDYDETDDEDDGAEPKQKKHKQAPKEKSKPKKPKAAAKRNNEEDVSSKLSNSDEEED